MGCNYYFHKNVCEHCGRAEEIIHIGKSSCGWCFTLHVGDEFDNIPHSLEEWKKLLNSPNSRIKNEYGKEIPYDELMSIILDRKGNKEFDFSREEDVDLQKNHAIRGPNNLWRHNPEISFGNGGKLPYDLVQGEFS
jgi:hypothetical protein